MNKDETRKYYDRLIEQYRELNRHYYDLDAPLVDDATYDAIVREISDIEDKNPFLKKSGSAIDRVGGKVSVKFSSVSHDPPMLSLANILETDELDEFDERCRRNSGQDMIVYSAELKYDGLAVEIVYVRGELMQGSTRGDGESGEDITENIKTIGLLPHRVSGKDVPDYLSVRGEVYLTHDEFARINREREGKGEQLFANPRNAAAGSLRQLDPEIVRNRNLSVVLYGIGKTDGDVIKNQMEMYSLYESLCLPVSKNVAFGKIHDIAAFFNHWKENRYTLNFDIDGIVVKAADFAIRKKIGATSKAPRWAVAWKFPAREAITGLLEVENSLGRTGVVTPVAHLCPINIGGVLVGRATLHNYREIERLGIMIGDEVRVIRAGDVIPKITGVLTEKRKGTERKIEQPDRCPACDSELTREDIFIRCDNPGCKGKRYENLLYFVSKDGMDIEYFGPELVKRLYDAGKISKPSDIYAITKDDLLELDRMGDVLADKIMESITARKNISLSHLLRSLGIRNVGDHVAKLLAKGTGSLERLMKIPAEELQQIHEIGPGVAESIRSYFDDHENMEIIGKMREQGVVIRDEETEVTDELPFSGMTFVLTGTLETCTREMAEEAIERLGGRASSSVSGKTRYLVAGEKAGSKLEKARSLGIEILSENEFIAMIKGLGIELNG